MKYKFKLIVSTIVLAFLVIKVNSQANITRNELFDTSVNSNKISTIKVVEISFPPAQKAPYHIHPCIVVGQIISGECLIQIEGQQPAILKTGDIFYEPANTPVIHFDNNSQQYPLKFIAYYLANGEKELTKILPQKTTQVKMQSPQL